jgi:hypothetical protein
MKNAPIAFSATARSPSADPDDASKAATVENRRADLTAKNAEMSVMSAANVGVFPDDATTG